MRTRISIAAALVVAAATVTGAATAGHTSVRERRAAYAGTIAFVRDDALYVIHADGSGLRRVTPPATPVHEYAWSPSGRLIAFIDSRRNSLWLVRPDGTGLRRLLRGSKLASTRLSWSPDGTRIAITSPGSFSKVKTTDCGGGTIYVVPISGSHPTKFRDRFGRVWSCDDPAWSPRGDEIAYDLDGGGIWVIHPDGTDDRPVWDSGVAPHWSSDGKQLAFYDVAGGGMGAPSYREFAVVESGGTHYHVVTKQAYTKYGEVWSPRGQRILYGHAKGGIYVIGSNGQNNRRVTTDSPGQSEASKLAWSPDGGSIVYAASTGGLYEVGVDGRGKVRLTSPADGDFAPSWVAR